MRLERRRRVTCARARCTRRRAKGNRKNEGVRESGKREEANCSHNSVRRVVQACSALARAHSAHDRTRHAPLSDLRRLAGGGGARRGGGGPCDDDCDAGAAPPPLRRGRRPLGPPGDAGPPPRGRPGGQGEDEERARERGAARRGRARVGGRGGGNLSRAPCLVLPRMPTHTHTLLPPSLLNRPTPAPLLTRGGPPWARRTRAPRCEGWREGGVDARDDAPAARAPLAPISLNARWGFGVGAAAGASGRHRRLLPHPAITGWVHVVRQGRGGCSRGAAARHDTQQRATRAPSTT